MLKKMLLLTIGFMLSLAAIAKDDLPMPQKTLQQLDTIVATVNSDIITQNEFDNALAFTKQQFKQRNLPLPSKKTLREKVLQNLIDRQLQLQLAQQHNIKASEKEVDQRIQLIAQQNHVSISQLKAQVVAEGLSYSAFKKRLHDQIVIGKVQQQLVQGSVAVNNDDIQAFRDKQASDVQSALFNIGDILIPVADVKDNAQKSKAHTEALALMRAIQKGSSVADAVKKFNAQYTDLGWRQLSDLPTLFSQPIASTKVKGLSGPILAPNGYHVLYLIGRKSGVSQLTDQQIQNMLLQKKYEEAVNEALKKIRKEAYVKINPDYQ